MNALTNEEVRQLIAKKREQEESRKVAEHVCCACRRGIIEPYMSFEPPIVDEPLYICKSCVIMLRVMGVEMTDRATGRDLIAEFLDKCEAAGAE